MAVVLITGSCGLVGSESSEFFSGKGFEILGIDKVQIYDGSWTEWGSIVGFPVEQG